MVSIGEGGIAQMYHYDPERALQEVQEDSVLPHPVHVRDMMLRAHLSPDRALDLNRRFQTYLQLFGETQKIAQELLAELSAVEA